METSRLIDILMVTFDRPTYVRRSLGRLLDTCDDEMRVWLWHNGNDGATLEVVRSFLEHPNVVEFVHSRENQRLTAPTNWLWETAKGNYFSKVDDDCLVSPGWAQRLRQAHEDYEGFGVLGSWRFLDEDFRPRHAKRKIRQFPGNHRVLQNFWVQGSGYLMKRRCVDDLGPLPDGLSFNSYCVRLALAGWVNGWYYPFIREEDMDDPRSPSTGLKDDNDLLRRLPLSAERRGIRTLEGWERQIREFARTAQKASIDPKGYQGWRRTVRKAAARGYAPLGRP